jgi:hypothetical protein
MSLVIRVCMAAVNGFKSESDDAFSTLVVASLFTGLLTSEDVAPRQTSASDVLVLLRSFVNSAVGPAPHATRRGALRGAGRVRKWKRGSVARPSSLMSLSWTSPQNDDATTKPIGTGQARVSERIPILCAVNLSHENESDHLRRMIRRRLLYMSASGAPVEGRSPQPQWENGKTNAPHATSR